MTSEMHHYEKNTSRNASHGKSVPKYMPAHHVMTRVLHASPIVFPMMYWMFFVSAELGRFA